MSGDEDARDVQLQKELADCVMSSSWIFCLRYQLYDDLPDSPWCMH